MRINSLAERIALNPKRQNRPVSHWEALQGKTVVDQNKSIALLRFKWSADKTITYRAIR